MRKATRQIRIDSPYKREGNCTWEYWDPIKHEMVRCKRPKTGWFFCDEHKISATQAESGSFSSTHIRVTSDND